MGAADLLIKPTSENTIPEIKAYLDSMGIAYKVNETKADLLSLVGV